MKDSGPRRLIWVDALKGWLMLLVVMGHAIQWTLGDETDDSHVWNIIYSFHMPAFFAVSGWLAYRPGRQGKGPTIGHSHTAYLIVRRAQQLLIPFFCWSLVIIISRRLNFFSAMAGMIEKPDNSFWFLWALFFIYLIFHVSVAVSRQLRCGESAVILLVGAFLSALMVVFQLNSFGFQFIAYYFLFFSLGYFIHKYPWLQITHKAWLAALFAVWVILAWWWRMHELPPWVSVFATSSWLQYAYRGVTATIAILVLINVSPLLLDSDHWTNRRMGVVGAWSMGIYTVHLSILTMLLHGIEQFIPKSYYVAFVCVLFFSALIISLALVYLIMKNKYTARLLMGKF